MNRIIERLFEATVGRAFAPVATVVKLLGEATPVEMMSNDEIDALASDDSRDNARRA